MHRRPGSGEAGAQHGRCPRLAGAAGDGDDASLTRQSGTGGSGDTLQRAQGVVDADQCTRRLADVIRPHQRGSRSGSEGSRDELVAVTLIFQSDEDFAVSERARIDRQARDRPVRHAVGLAFRRGEQCLERPKRCGRESLDGCGDLLLIGEREDGVADDLAGLVALAGHEQDVALAEHGNAPRGWPRRGRRSRCKRALPCPCAAARISARI